MAREWARAIRSALALGHMGLVLLVVGTSAQLGCIGGCGPGGSGDKRSVTQADPEVKWTPRRRLPGWSGAGMVRCRA